MLSNGLVGWSLKNVRFQYPGASATVFNEFDAQIRPGETCVIRGPSGAGKTTLLGILLGELKPGLGEVNVSNESGVYPLASVRSELLPRVGYVGPESFLLEGSIRENLVYGLDRVPSDTEVQHALDLAECGFVRELPRGLDHHLTEQGQGLSAGQKQRLSLARALLRDPRILVLDEATSNLDTETEGRLVETLSGLKRKMTLIVVTHRDQPLKLADQTIQLS